MGLAFCTLSVNPKPVKHFLGGRQFVLTLIIFATACAAIPFRDSKESNRINCVSIYCRDELESRFEKSRKLWELTKTKNKNTYTYLRCDRPGPEAGFYIEKTVVNDGRCVIAERALDNSGNDDCKFDFPPTQVEKIECKTIDERFNECQKKILSKSLWTHDLRFEVNEDGIMKECFNYEHWSGRADYVGSSVRVDRVDF